jgi:hypothetical protein
MTTTTTATANDGAGVFGGGEWKQRGGSDDGMY